MRGRFITFEGGEGAGKSTQIARLKRRLVALGHRIAATREPGGSEKAEHIRRFILSGRAKALGPGAEALLFYAARLDHRSGDGEMMIPSGSGLTSLRLPGHRRQADGSNLA